MKILLVGKAGAGKDTVADILVRDYGYTRYAFADKLKEIAKDLFPDHFQEGKPRRLLQELGVKMREIDPDVWVNYVLNRVQGENVVITDGRFDNEVNLCRRAGFVVVEVSCPPEIRVLRLAKRDGRFPTEEELSHVSEGLDVEPDYYLLNTGDKLHLRGLVRRMVESSREGGLENGPGVTTDLL